MLLAVTSLWPNIEKYSCHLVMFCKSDHTASVTIYEVTKLDILAPDFSPIQPRLLGQSRTLPWA